MVKDTKEKKEFWNTWLGKTVSFVGKYTGISWILGKISSGWNSVKSWFSSSGATKAGAGQPEAKTKGDGKNVPAEAPQVPSPNQARNGTPGQPLDKSEVPGSAAEKPAKPTPNGMSATPSSGPAGPATGGESDMQETKQNPVKPDSTPLIQPLSPEVEKLSGKITVYTDGKREVELKLNVGKHFDTLEKWKNLAAVGEFCAFMEHGGKTLYITGRYSSKTEVGGNVFAINSVGIHGTDTAYGSDNLEKMKNLVGLNETTAVEVEISNVPFKAPEVESSKTPKKTTEGTPPVEPKMTKESEADKFANVVDTDSPQGSGAARSSEVPVENAKVAPKSPELKVKSPEDQDKDQQLEEDKASLSGGEQDHEVLESLELKVKSPEPAAIGGTQAEAAGSSNASPVPAKDQSEGGGPKGETKSASTPPVTEGSPQPQGGTGTAESEAASSVVVVNSSSEAAKSSKEQPAATVAHAAIDETQAPLKEVVDTSEGQEPKSKVPEGQEDAREDSPSDSEEEKEHTEGVSEAPFEGRSRAASSASGESLEDGAKSANGEAQLTEMDRQVEQLAPGDNRKK